MHSIQIRVALLKTVSASPRKIPVITSATPRQRDTIEMIFRFFSVNFIFFSFYCHTDSIFLTKNQEKDFNEKSLDFSNPCDNFI